MNTLTKRALSFIAKNMPDELDIILDQSDENLAILGRVFRDSIIDWNTQPHVNCFYSSCKELNMTNIHDFIDEHPLPSLANLALEDNHVEFKQLYIEIHGQDAWDKACIFTTDYMSASMMEFMTDEIK